MNGPIPDWLLTPLAALTVFTVMFGLGLGIAPGQLRTAAREPGLLARGVFSVLVAVPALALLITGLFDLPRHARIGIVLMAIAPGAPISLRRSLTAGGHRVFAPALQLSVASLAVISMPLSIAALNHYFDGNASIQPDQVAHQVFLAPCCPWASAWR